MTQPVIIVGAGRSGTNALRDALCTLRHFHTWPCDEINYIWRHGNRDWPTDELTRAHASPQVKAFIRNAFDEQWSKDPGATLVEKTCANSLRVEFVHEIFPDARFVHIVRDGRDVAASAMGRWTAPLDVPYLTAKARFVPTSDLPHYALRYLSSRISKVRSDEDRLSWWGPKFEGMDLLTPDTPLVEVAARQWERCVTAAFAQLDDVDQDQVMTIHYQSLAEDPGATLRDVTSFLGEEISDTALSIAASTIHAGSVGKWKTAISEEQLEALTPIVRPALELIGLDS